MPYIEDIIKDVQEAKKQGFSERELEEYLTKKYGSDSARKALYPDVQRIELMGAEVITIKGKPGDKPTERELLALITPLIPQVEDGHTPTKSELLGLIEPLIPQVEDGKTPSKEELIALIKPLIPKVENGKTPTPEEITEIVRPLIPKVENGKNALPPKHEWNGLNLRFENPDGTWGNWINLQATVKISSPKSSKGGGGLSASGIYTETPTGAINDVNVTYTVQNEIHNVIGFAINGQYIHPVEYSTSGKTITFVTPLPTALSGTSFSVTYV